MSDTQKLPPYRNVVTAPYVYFDIVACNGVMAGAVELELAARTLSPTTDGGVEPEFVTTARLRCSPSAAAALRDAIANSLELLEQAQTTAGAATGSSGKLN